MNLKIGGLTPFVPARDFAMSSRFYRDLGFAAVASIEQATRFEKDGYGFWLQDYYVEDWAGNFMFCMYVADLDAWRAHLGALHLSEVYGGEARVINEPHPQEGGRMMQFSDPAGVLWHVRQQ
jgi:catechol 2,3-dioxygenase-like lactoylglutathione lyase family enzyme